MTESVEATQVPEEQVTMEEQAPVQSVAPVSDEVASAFGQKRTFEYKDENGNVLRAYHFQFPGVEAGLKIADLAGTNMTEYRKQLVKQLVTDPEVRSQGLEWFDTHKGMFEVLGALDTFLGELLDGVRF